MAERYPTFDVYDKQVITAMNTMIQDRLLLCEDGNSELARLRANGVTRGVPNPPASFATYPFPLANSEVASSQITGPMSANLRSERSGTARNGHVYTLQLACSDGASNTGTKTVAVTVPHDQRGK